MAPAKLQRDLAVRSLSANRQRGWLMLGTMRIPCSLGRTGRAVLKREGDGRTPAGAFRLVGVRYRADRVRRPQTGLPILALRSSDGWCDAVGDRNYNRPVRHPYGAGAEAMWRDDHLYDLVVVIDYNLRRRVQGRGSAIFLHLERPDRGPTAGCIAVAARDMRLLLARLRRGSRLRISG